MAAIIRDSFKVNALTQFISSLSTNSLYMGIGRPQYWDTVGNLDSSIPSPENTTIGVNADWEDIMSLKKLNLTDAAVGIYKESWQANVKYDAYRHDWNGTITSVYNGPNSAPTTPSSLGDVKCFVVTANYNIYLCLKQPILLGIVQPSIYNPESGTAIGTNTTIVKTADGYYWKYIGTTSTADTLKFSNKYYHPLVTLRADPGGSSTYYPQWLAQQYSTNKKGGIYVINVLTNGSGYNGGVAGTINVTDAEGDVQFSVIGDGTGLAFTVTYGASGSILDVEITNPGTGYTHAVIIPATGTGATFDIIYTPAAGLGCDPVKNLVARYLILNTQIVGAEGSGDFTTTNDYRKITLMMNPTIYGTATVATAATLDATQTLMMGTGLAVGAYPVDAIVTGATSHAKGRVVDFNTTGALRIIRTSSENLGNVGANNSFQVAESVTSSPGTGNAVIASIVNPEVQKSSGDVLYSEYRAPTMRGVSQTDDIKIILKF
jgi:hypothetical protein